MSDDIETAEPDYLTQAANTLHKALTYWEQTAMKNADTMRAEILDARLRIAHGFAELAAVQRGVPLEARPEPGRQAP